MIYEYIKRKQATLAHDGVQYLQFLRLLADNLSPSSYLEIGTNEGSSLDSFRCDALCIDPEFRLQTSPVSIRERSFFFQMTSDKFFQKYNVRTFFPNGPDICFLDGLHRFEFLLRDFINVEAACRPTSIIVLHDCLPSNARMAERTMRVDQAEDSATREAWTGDVWRILPILKQHRPDLRVMLLDCGPTGLVACTGLNPGHVLLRQSYDRIVDEAMNLSLENIGLDNLWSIFPTIDTRRLAAHPEDITALFNIA